MTDRVRLCSGTRWRECLLKQIAFAVEAGIDVVQIRERDLPTADLVSLVGDAVSIARGSATRVVVNDRVDVALACGASGVHLRSDSIPANRVRAMVPPGFLIGQSVHDAAPAVAAAPHVDYLIAGTVWASESKPGATTHLGEAGLKRIAGAVQRPVLAIGGVTLGRFEAVRAAGAAGAAAIGLFMAASPQPPGECRAMALSHIVKGARSRLAAPG